MNQKKEEYCLFKSSCSKNKSAFVKKFHIAIAVMNHPQDDVLTKFWMKIQHSDRKQRIAVQLPV